jgi:hypothetical protein
MIASDNRTSWLFGVPGILLQIAGQVLAQMYAKSSPPDLMLAFGSLGLSLIGTMFLLIGFAYYAKAKGRNPSWCILAFFSIFGLIVLYCLKDYTEEQNQTPPKPSAGEKK